MSPTHRKVPLRIALFVFLQELNKQSKALDPFVLLGKEDVEWRQVLGIRFKDILQVTCLEMVFHGNTHRPTNAVPLTRCLYDASSRIENQPCSRVDAYVLTTFRYPPFSQTSRRGVTAGAPTPSESAAARIEPSRTMVRKTSIPCAGMRFII